MRFLKRLVAWLTDPCTYGLHRPGPTRGIYKLGRCERCGKEDMWF
jgi:hypothetical protein